MPRMLDTPQKLQGVVGHSHSMPGKRHLTEECRLVIQCLRAHSGLKSPLAEELPLPIQRETKKGKMTDDCNK